MKPSEFDVHALSLIRNNINKITNDYILPLDVEGNKVLEIGPSELHNIKFHHAIHHSVDISPNIESTYNIDICSEHDIKSIEDKYNIILLFEVLEHVSNPFTALQNLRRVISKDGFLYITTPFNFRIHGPLPDNWRFTVHGLNQLLRQGSWEAVKVVTIESTGRPLMPIHYFTLAKPI